MCGIWSYIAKILGVKTEGELFEAFDKIQPRGPDRSTFHKVQNDLYLGFHRLAIMDKSTRGDQPFVFEFKDRTVYVLCNGEIYNFLDSR